MSRVEALDHAQQPAPALSSQSACKNNFGEHIVEGRKEGKKEWRKREESNFKFIL